MAGTITSPYGSTSQGTQLQSVTDALNSIKNAPTPAVQNAVDTSNAALVQGPQNQQFNTMQNQLSDQVTQPLYNQMNNLTPQFQMWLSDQGLAQKYAQTSGGSGTMNPYGDQSLMNSSTANTQAAQEQNLGDQNSVGQLAASIGGPNMSALAPSPNQSPYVATPYAASPDQLIASAANTPQAPSLTTAELAQPVTGGWDMVSLLNSLVGQENTLATDTTTQARDKYQGTLSALQTLAGLAQSELNSRNSGGSGSSSTAGSYYQDAKQSYAAQMEKEGKTPTWDGFWYYMNSNKNAWAAQGINVDEMYKLQAADRQQFGGQGNIMTGNVATKTGKQMTVTSSLPTATNKNPGWKIKKSDGSTVAVTKSSGLFSKSPTLSVQDIISHGQSLGESEDTILNALRAGGYSVQ